MTGFLTAGSITRRSCLTGVASPAITALLYRGSARAAEAKGTVTATVGLAVAETPAGSRTLQQADPIFLNDLLRTGDNSRLMLQLGSSTSIRLGARARLRIDRFVVNAGGELSFDAGQVLLESPGASFPKGLVVRSPYALIAVRGTKVWGGLLGDAFAVFVERGLVTVSAAGVAVALGSGEGTTIPRIGAPPGPVVRWPAEKIALAMAMVN